MVRLAWLVVALVATAAFADDVSVRASVDRSTVRDNESFTYTIRADGPVRGEPEIAPVSRQFDVLQSTSSSQIQIVNGQTSQTVEWQYQLMPKGAGDFTLPPVRVGDRQTNTVALHVVRPQNAAGAPADIFMELEEQPSKVYVQSELVLTLRLFTGVATGRATLTPPQIMGGEAIVEKLGEDTQYQTQRGGRDFVVHERRYAVFPQRAGQLTIGPATFEAMVIPDRGFSRVQRFRSGTVSVDVQPAVPPPASMPDAVWLPARHVELSESWSDDSGELTVGVPRTRKIVVEADGLLETQLPDLTIAQQSGIREYADQPDLGREATADGFKSHRTVSFAVIAQVSGDVTLAPVRLPWWNVTTGRWELAELPERTLHVAPSGEPPAATPAVQPQTTSVPKAERPRSAWPLVAVVLGAAWLVTVGLWWRARNRSRRAPGRDALIASERPQAPLRPEPQTARRCIRELRSACTQNDPEAARRALLAWGEAQTPATPPRSLGALASLLPDDLAREVLHLEAHIYGAAQGDWDATGLKAVLPVLEANGAARHASTEEPLLPLYR